MKKLSKILFITWTLIFVCVLLTFFILSHISKDRIYNANLQIKASDVLESNERFYDAKLKFTNPIFRAQKNISHIEIIDFTFADSKDSIESKNIHNFSHKNQNYITFSMPQNAAPPSSVKFTITFEKTFFLHAFIGYIVGIVAYIFAFVLYKILIKSIKTSPKTNALILSVFSVAASICILYNGHSWAGDFSQYISQSIAFVDSLRNVDSIYLKNQIANNTWIINHSDILQGPYIYPWGFPLLLAPIIALFGADLFALKFVGVASLGVFVYIFHCFISAWVRQSLAIFASLFFSANILFLDFTNNILSDIPFMLFNFAAALMLSALFRESKASFGYILIASLVALFASLIRTNGVVIFIALFIMHLLLLYSYIFRHFSGVYIRKSISFIESIGIKSSTPFTLHTLPYIIFLLALLALARCLVAVGRLILAF